MGEGSKTVAWLKDKYPPLLDIGQASEMTGLNKRTLWKLRRHGAVKTSPVSSVAKHYYLRDNLIDELKLADEE